MNRRAILIILDSLGVGEMPDCQLFGDQGCNTLQNTAAAVGGLSLPNLQKLGLGNITEVLGVSANHQPQAAYGRMNERSRGKDTTTGHWEMMGLILDQPFPTYPDGFPVEVIQEFEHRISRKTLGNKVASGTVIIEELGREHMQTGYPIVYTSADSVFQIAAHEEIIPLEDLYHMCQTAREMLVGEHAVGRVIARPFVGKPGSFKRTSNRHDYSLQPPVHIMDILIEQGCEVIGVGKIKDIFAGRSVTTAIPTTSNQDGVDQVLAAMQPDFRGLIFANLVDFDQLYGHRNDPHGYARAIEEFDRRLPELLGHMGPEDLLIITADHGCDPTTEGTDHTREYVPLLVYGPSIQPADLGTRETFADVGQSIADHLGVKAENMAGKSFLPEVRK